MNPCKGGPVDAYNRKFQSKSDNSKFEDVGMECTWTKSPMDIYSQCEFLRPGLLGYDSFYAFQGRYAVVQRKTMGSHAFQQIVGFRNLDELTNKIDMFSYRVLKKDCLDLPDKIYTVRF